MTRFTTVGATNADTPDPRLLRKIETAGRELRLCRAHLSRTKPELASVERQLAARVGDNPEAQSRHRPRHVIETIEDIDYLYGVGPDGKPAPARPTHHRAAFVCGWCGSESPKLEREQAASWFLGQHAKPHPCTNDYRQTIARLREWHQLVVRRDRARKRLARLLAETGFTSVPRTMKVKETPMGDLLTLVAEQNELLKDIRTETARTNELLRERLPGIEMQDSDFDLALEVWANEEAV